MWVLPQLHKKFCRNKVFKLRLSKLKILPSQQFNEWFHFTSCFTFFSVKVACETAEKFLPPHLSRIPLCIKMISNYSSSNVDVRVTSVACSWNNKESLRSSSGWNNFDLRAFSSYIFFMWLLLCFSSWINLCCDAAHIKVINCCLSQLTKQPSPRLNKFRNHN